MSLWMNATAMAAATPAPATPPSPTSSLPSATQAAQAAAQGPACTAARPFYWELGNAQGVQANGQVGDDAPTAATEMAIASASKWVYGAWVVERRQGQLTPQDIDFLRFQSGHTRFRSCLPFQSVGSCATRIRNGRGEPEPATAGHFSYGGGHMQQHAVLMGLGELSPTELAQAIKQGLPALGPSWGFSYGQAQLAGGGHSSAAAYGQFLRAILRGELKMASALGQHAVCTNPRTCPGALKTPIPETESWHYSMGHWVEDDPAVGDGAFSSPGAFGFYPWISADRSAYGIVARASHRHLGDDDEDQRPAVQSLACGRAIRAAWLQTSREKRTSTSRGAAL
jgi:hypothetical protein